MDANVLEQDIISIFGL